MKNAYKLLAIAPLILANSICLAQNVITDFTYNISGLTVNFTNTTNYMGCIPIAPDWDFGDPSSANNQSILNNPSFTYSTPGTYRVLLMTNVKSSCTYGSNFVTKTVTVPGATGLDNLNIKADTYKVYPNPAKSFVNIESRENQNIDKVEIINITGQTVLMVDFPDTGDSPIKQIDITSLSKGIYQLRLYNANNVTNQLIIKQ